MKPPAVALRLVRWTFLFAVFVSLAGCASLSGAGAASQCGDPCASVSCPSAFTCSVDGRCVARCQPEPARPGTF